MLYIFQVLFCLFQVENILELLFTKNYLVYDLVFNFFFLLLISVKHFIILEHSKKLYLLWYEIWDLKGEYYLICYIILTFSSHILHKSIL